VGEPQNGFPSPAERLGLMMINRARSDPATVKGAQSQMYPAVRPVGWAYELNRSSRFHAMNLELAKANLMHTSPCPLNGNVASANCSGDPACACSSPVPNTCANCAQAPPINNCGTDPFVRIGMFTAGSQVGASGEVAAAGYSDPKAVVDGWMDEAAGQDGHRRNLTDQGISSNVMGYGHAQGANCWPTFDVSDSGQGNPPATKVPTAAVNPPAGNGTFTFYATWADGAGAPASIDVVVDGHCTAMTRELGSDTLNATYKVAVPLQAGCSSYWILAKDSGGGRTTYPSSGAVTINVGGAGCGSEFLAQAPAADCENAPPPDLATNATQDLSFVQRDFSVKPGVDFAGQDLFGRDLTGTGAGAGIGDPCMRHADCDSGVCALDGANGYCTVACDNTPGSCPAGFVCGLIGTDPYCIRGASGGGCSIAPRTETGGFPLALAAALLGLAIRRRGGRRTGS
jgi:hypothetical protein